MYLYIYFGWVTEVKTDISSETTVAMVIPRTRTNSFPYFSTHILLSKKLNKTSKLQHRLLSMLTMSYLGNVTVLRQKQT